MRSSRIISLFLALVFVTAFIPASLAADETSGITIACGGEHSLAVKSDGSLWSWGLNRFGQLGASVNAGSLLPVKVMDSCVSVSSAFGHVLAVKTDGSLWGWGWNAWGQVGDGTKNNAPAPVLIMDGGVVKAVAAHYRCITDGIEQQDDFYSYSLALMVDGSLFAWGMNSFGQLGTGNFDQFVKPHKIMDDVIDIEADGGSSYAIKSDGSVWAWGRNVFGQLGTGDFNDRLSPVKVMDSGLRVAAGSDHTFFIKKDGSVWASGHNIYGQLGDGSFDDQPKPVSVLDSVKYVAAGGDHTFAIRNDNSLWGWGYNSQGQLGDGTGNMSYMPKKIMDDVALISATENRSLAATLSGDLYAWGFNVNDEFGRGANNNTRYMPQKIMDGIMLSSQQPAVKAYEGASAWAVPSIAGLSSLSLVPQGINSDYKNFITRAEFSALMLNIYEHRLNKASPVATPFDDISGHKYESQIQSAFSVGIISGASATKFAPDAYLTREQAAKIISDTVTKTIGISVPEASALSYTDASAISAWAVKYIAYAGKNGLMQGEPGNRFNPSANLTREQAMAIAFRACTSKS